MDSLLPKANDVDKRKKAGKDRRDNDIGLEHGWSEQISDHIRTDEESHTGMNETCRIVLDAGLLQKFGQLFGQPASLQKAGDNSPRLGCVRLKESSPATGSGLLLRF